jgi:hypothetical protein|tara:strand:+ start:8920 stop:9147 length:228 start_codon:yes stop_codon:yes gene_type:complete
MKERLPDLIQSVTQFRHVLVYLTPEQCTAVTDVMKNQLPGIIQTSRQFGVALGKLSQEQFEGGYSGHERCACGAD